MLRALGSRILSTAPATFVRRLPSVVAAGAAVGGVFAIAAGVWSINRSAGMITTGVLLLGCAAGWYRGSQ